MDIVEFDMGAMESVHAPSPRQLVYPLTAAAFNYRGVPPGRVKHCYVWTKAAER